LLLERGLPVRAMVRREDDRAQALRSAGADVVVGDLLEPADVLRVVRGCRRIYFGMSTSAAYLEATVTMAAVDVAAALADIAIEKPLNGTIELAGPEPICMDELVRRFLNARHDARQVTTDDQALYYGIKVNDESLTPGDHPRFGPTRFGDWLERSASESAGNAGNAARVPGTIGESLGGKSEKRDRFTVCETTQKSKGLPT
jgi:uncharacterized protein YbjT (DUF2867 family)